MFDSGTVDYFVLEVSETESPALEATGGVCQIEDTTKGVMVRAESEISTLGAWTKGWKYPENGEVFLVGR